MSQIEQDAHAALVRYHATFLDEPGPGTARLRRLAAPRLQPTLWRVLIARWIAVGSLMQRGSFLHLPGHQASLSAAEAKMSERLAGPLAQAGYKGVKVSQLANEIGEGEGLVRMTLSRMARLGHVHQVATDIYYPRATLQSLTIIVRQVGTAHDGDITAARFRDAIQVSRRRAILVLEYFDRIGLLRRIGDVHRLRPDADTLPFEDQS